MRRPDKTGGKAVKPRRRKTLKRRDTLKAVRRRTSTPADRETNVVRLGRELNEAFEQQAATADILNIISSSPTDTQPVFDAIVQSGLKLFPDALISLALRYGDKINAAAIAERDPEGAEAWRRSISRTPLSREYMHGAAMLDCKIVDIPDVRNAPAELAAGARNFLTSGYRAITITPMMCRNEAIGLLSVVRRTPGPLSDKQLSLLRTFAAQAVIAIENTRLLNELRETLERQTATSEVLAVISSSPGELKPVFEAMLASAVRICEAKFGVLFLSDGDGLRTGAMHNAPEPLVEAQHREPLYRPPPNTAIGRMVRTKGLVHIPDILAEKDYFIVPPGQSRPRMANAGARTVVAVPMLKDDELVGAIGIYRQEVRPFADKQIAVLKTFAAQAVIAIENARLLNELRERTDDLTESLENLRSTQDRLVQTQKLASLGQLTAGIAHEIKNPLNFVNNFSAVSSELIDELQDTLKRPLDDKARAEIMELTNTLRGNLDKVVQHGKRADAIVKNMLQHSREGSGEHRPVDINSLVEESLNFAYHGARAEKQGFNITLERSFDPAAGEADLFPQDITRVLLNLISNGFYAATKRRAETNGGDYKPTLAAATKNLGDRVEISIRDNGTGIPPEVKEKMFNPFFTTKPAGEGTGLGLSISHDIVVKQHGGAIEADTQPGEFTEIRVILPRAAVVS